MTQRRIFDFHAPEDTELLNDHIGLVSRIGIHSGFEVFNGSAGFVSLKAGALLTADGVVIEEDADQNDFLAIPSNASGNPRIDYVVLRHEYIKTVPPPAATYEIIQGTPDASPSPPLIPDDAVILARGQLEDSATAYTDLIFWPADEVYNATFDGQTWRVIYGDKAAILVRKDLTDGEFTVSIVPAETAASGEPITWAIKLTVTDAGIQEVLDEATARAAADVTLQENIDTEATTRGNADTAIHNALLDAKGRPWDEDVPADEDMAEMADRLDDAESDISTHVARVDNPHVVTAAQAGAIASIDGVSNDGGDVALIATDAITITPDDPNDKITIGEDHSALTDNPHAVTHTQAGAAPAAEGVTNGNTHDHDGGDGAQIPTAGIENQAVDKTKINADIRGDGIGGVDDEALAVVVDDVTIEIASNTLQVKDGGIDESKVSGNVARWIAGRSINSDGSLLTGSSNVMRYGNVSNPDGGPADTFDVAHSTFQIRRSALGSYNIELPTTESWTVTDLFISLENMLGLQRFSSIERVSSTEWLIKIYDATGLEDDEWHFSVFLVI